MFTSKQALMYILGILIIFVLGASAGFVFKPDPLPPTQALRESGFKYIRPILVCNVEPQSQNEDSDFSRALQKYIDTAKEKDIGIYYINPAMGKWAGANQNTSFSPASMLKVPIMVAVLRYAEEHPGILSQKIYYDGSFDHNAAEIIKPAKSIKVGQSYSVEELLSYMIVNSDNNATQLLHEFIPEKDFENVFTDLGIEVPTPSGPIDFMSPKTFTLFLRILYNSSYLSHELSEKALSLMTEKGFSQGLVGGVPPETTIAHKFGERVTNTVHGGLQQELHDCGVVYLPNEGAYILCVMARGDNTQILIDQIRDISTLVYKHVMSE